MKGKTYLAAAALSALALVSCNKNNVTPVPEDGTVAARITAGIGGVQTRAAGSSWAAKDAIGISTVTGTKTDYSNIPYKWDGTSFLPDGTAIYFQSPEVVTFNAYYPFTGTVGTSAGTIKAVTKAANQTVGTQPLIDFLYASGAKADKTDPIVAFTDKTADDGEDNSFKHKMSQVTLKFIEGDDMSFEGRLASYTLKGLCLEGTFNTVTGVAEADAETAAEDLTIALNGPAATAGVYLAAPLVFFPQSVSGGQIALEVVVDGETYRTNLACTSLDAGNNYIFPVKVKKTGLSAGDAKIKDWSDVVGDSTDATM